VYQLIVFDWEGTLSDTLGCVLDVVSEQAQKLGLSAIDYKVARDYVNLGIEEAIVKLYPNEADITHSALLMGVSQSMSHVKGACLFQGAKAWLTSLKSQGIFLGLATNKGKSSLHRALITADLDNFFDCICTASDYALKPSPDMLLAILNTLNVDASHALMIGDSVADIEMARALNVDAIGVDFYHQMEDSLKHAGANAVYDDFIRLADAINPLLLIGKE